MQPPQRGPYGGLTHGACGCYPPPPPTGNGGGGSPPPQPTKRAGAPGHHLTEGGGGPHPQAQTRTHGATGEPLRKGRVRKYPAAPLMAACCAALGSGRRAAGGVRGRSVGAEPMKGGAAHGVDARGLVGERGLGDGLLTLHVYLPV